MTWFSDLQLQGKNFKTQPTQGLGTRKEGKVTWVRRPGVGVSWEEWNDGTTLHLPVCCG